MEKKHDHSLAIPYKLNVTLAAGHILINLYQFFILPLYFLPRSPWWALSLVPVAALNNPFWSLIHEAIHDMLHPSSRMNRALGRVLSIFFGSPFRVVRLSHLLHHKLNRTPTEATELFDSERTSWLQASFGYYFYILGGLYLYEAISPLPFFLPKNVLRRMEQRFFSRNNLAGSLMRSLMTEESVREMRTDGALILALFGFSFFCYGEHWWLLAVVLMNRAFLISFLDNIYHYRTPVNDIFYANNLWLPSLLAGGLLHFNLHGIHHRNPTIPWSILPQVFGAERRKLDGNYFTAAVRQLWGPVPLSELPHWRPAADRRLSGSF